MSGKSRWDYLKAIYFRYKKVSKPLRSRIAFIALSRVLSHFGSSSAYFFTEPQLGINKTSNHGARTVGHHIERAGVPAGDKVLMDFIRQAIEKSQKCAEKNQVGARCRAGQSVNHEKAQGSVGEHVKHLVRLGELIRRGQIRLRREHKDQSHVKKSRKPMNKSSSHVGCTAKS